MYIDMNVIWVVLGVISLYIFAPRFLGEIIKMGLLLGLGLAALYIHKYYPPIIMAVGALGLVGITAFWIYTVYVLTFGESSEQ